MDSSILNFVNYHKKRVNVDKDLAAGTLNNYFMAVKTFCEMNDLEITINWKKISRGLPPTKSKANDRAPTIEEILKLVGYPDRRIKAIVYTKCFSGIRIRAWKYLRWKHVRAIKNEKTGEVIAAELTVYADEPEEYYSFITPEAYSALKVWIDFRDSHGERTDVDSWLTRDLWETSNVNYGGKWGLAKYPKQLQVNGIKKLLNRALWEQGLRQPLPAGSRRHSWKSAHGFRKFFKTHAESAGMMPLNVELLLSHGAGISDSYWRPIKDRVLDDYLKVVNSLTINYDNNKAILQKQVAELKEKSKEESYIIIGKLAEKEKETEGMKAQIDNATKRIGELATIVTERIKKNNEYSSPNASKISDEEILDKMIEETEEEAEENTKAVSNNF